MPIDQDRKDRQESRNRLLVLIGLCGLLAIAASPAIPLERLSHLVNEAGIGLVVAALLGWIVDSALKQDLVRDAVSAALGYLLADQLKGELRWVYGLKFMVSQTFHVRLDHLPEKKVVILHGNVTRRIKNISGFQTELILSGGTDEWFNSEGESEITKYAFTRRGIVTQIQPVKHIVGIGVSYEEPIKVDADETIEVTFSYKLTEHETGTEVLTYGYPIENPLVTLEVPPTLMARVVYSHREKYIVSAPLETGFIFRPLTGILLPHQDIRIFWYVRSNLDKRSKELNLPI